MAGPQVADGEDGRKIWRVAANILNKQSRRADRGWPSSCEVERGANDPQRKNLICYKMFYRASILEGLFGTTNTGEEPL
jgi:hypothetical protein